MADFETNADFTPEGGYVPMPGPTVRISERDPRSLWA